MTQHRIRAIETQYKNCRFRSRTEARWCVFFEYLGVKWEYEKEGYELPSGRYLPDFWLPDLACWVEIKPVSPTAAELQLGEELGDMTDHPVAIVSGMPGNETIMVYCSDDADAGGGTGWWGDGGDTDCRFRSPHWTCDSKGKLCFCSGNAKGSRSFMTPVWKPWSGMKLSNECSHDDPEITAIGMAHRAARSARFEHGEKG